MKLPTACLLVCILFSLSACSTGVNRSINRTPPQTADLGEFWSWFAKHENETYQSKNDSDPILKDIEAKLKSIDDNLIFKLGWTEPSYLGPTLGKVGQGMREIAISCIECDKNSCQHAQRLVAQACLPGAKPFHYNLDLVAINDRWCAVLGDHPASGMKYSWKVSSTSVIPDGVMCNAKRSGNKIDVVLYSDLPIENDRCDEPTLWFQNQTSTDKYIRDRLLERGLGEWYFENLLGQVTSKKLEAAPVDASNIRKLKTLFDNLSTIEEQKKFHQTVGNSDVASIARPIGRLASSWHDCDFQIQQ